MLSYDKCALKAISYIEMWSKKESEIFFVKKLRIKEYRSNNLLSFKKRDLKRQVQTSFSRLKISVNPFCYSRKTYTSIYLSRGVKK